MAPRLVTVALTALAAVPCPAQPAPLPKVLFLTHSAGFTHGVVRRVERGRKALAEKQLTHAARKHFHVEATQDCAAITKENLADCAAVVFYTTGELPLSDEQKAALIGFVETGGGFAGIHPATDTFYRYPRYGEMIGGYFDGHPWHREVGLIVEQPEHPAVMHLGSGFSIRDEIYQFKNFSRDDKTVLVRLDNDSVDVARGKREDQDYAISWCKDFGKGRVFYTALGHRPEVWADPRFLQHVIAGIRWTAADVLRRAPAGATALFDGTDTKHWRHHTTGEPIGWKVADGVLEVTPRAGSIVTAKPYRDFRMHVEFRTPREEKGQGQGKGNSGVYLQQRYEVQILDSHGLEPTANGCGSLYRQRAPDVNACREPLAWQTYDIDFRAARFADGAKTANARITVVHNGVTIHDDVELANKTGAGQKEGPEPRPILLQDHGNTVQFRNVWIVEM